MSLIEGTAGSVVIAPSGTPVTVGYITEWEANPKTDIKTQGPFIGNAAKAKVRAGKDLTGSMKGFVPSGRNVGQSALVAAHEGGTNIELALTSTDGYAITIANTIITDLKLGQKAAEGVPFECSFTDADGYTAVPTT